MREGRLPPPVDFPPVSHERRIDFPRPPQQFLITSSYIVSSHTYHPSPHTIPSLHMKSVVCLLLFMLAVQHAEGLALPPPKKQPVSTARRVLISLGAGLLTSNLVTAVTSNAALADAAKERKFQKYPSIRFISALGDPKVSMIYNKHIYFLHADISNAFSCCTHLTHNYLPKGVERQRL